MLDNFSFGIRWCDIHTDSFEGYFPRMTDYHTHSYYEISLITSEKAHIQVSDIASTSDKPQLVLIGPYVPHYIYCEPGTHYNRHNICFSVDFLSEKELEWQGLTNIFEAGAVTLELTREACETYERLYRGIRDETENMRKKLLLLYFLSLVAESSESSCHTTRFPSYVTSTMAYISTRYHEHITVDGLANRCGVSRATLMNAFRRHAGTTVLEYVTQCRLKHAVEMLRQGLPENQVAEKCGFSEASSMIRCFRRKLGLPPRKYLASLSDK